MITIESLRATWNVMTDAEREAWMKNVEANLDNITDEDVPAWSTFLREKRGYFAG